MIITLEGNIGAGKTTLATALFEECERRGLRVKYIREPVDSWTDYYGTNLLDLLYKEKERWAFMFQVNALVHMRKNDLEAVDYSRQGFVVIKERSLFSVRRIFTPLLQSYMSPAEYNILQELNSTIEDPRVAAVCDQTSPPVSDVTLYLRTDPAVCLERIATRGRPEESGNRVDIDYLRNLHRSHEEVVDSFIGCTIVAEGSNIDARDPKTIKVCGYEDEEHLIDVIMKHKICTQDVDTEQVSPDCLATDECE